MRGLRPEDYLEPTCIFCKPEDRTVTPVDLRRCLGRLDEYLARKDYEAAARHLDYWKREAEAGRDWRGLVTIENERMGLFRRMGLRERALEAVRAAGEMIPHAGLEGTVTAATTDLNIGTVYKNFSEPNAALAHYLRARAVYERELPPEDPRLAGLYNNLALVFADLGRYGEARALYARAIDILQNTDRGALEEAVTELNLANLAEAEQGLLKAEEEIEQRLDRAEHLLENSNLEHNGDYAFVCEKCAPVFDYYGRFAYAAELKERAKRIYEGN